LERIPEWEEPKPKKGNIYGHPHEETMQKLRTKVVTVYGTYNSGTIVASTDGTTVTFQGNPQLVLELT
jgi:competence protein ComEC